MRRLRGFTLLELVVVVVIIAISVAMLAPQLSAGGRWRDLQREADSLAARIRVAQDIAMLESREYGLVFGEDGYRFVYWDRPRGRFVAVEDPAATWAVKQFPEGISVAAGSDAADPILVLPAADDSSDETAGTTLAGGQDEPDYAPSVFLLSSGEVTPFTAVFRADGEEQEVVLRIDPLGDRIDERGTDRQRSQEQEAANAPAS